MKRWLLVLVFLVGCALPWGRPAQLGFFSDLCTWSPDLAPECCLQHDLSFQGGTPEEFMIANHELALCMYSHHINPAVVEEYFNVASSPAAWEHFNITETPQRHLPPNYPFSCREWRW